jgi:hypothetical protein
VFRIEDSLLLRVGADTRQRLGRGEVPQADRLRAVAGENATGVAGKASPEGEDVWSVFGQGSRADEDARHFVELGVGVLGVAA